MKEEKITLWFKNHSITLLLSVLFLLIVFINAWLADDAFITFRTIDNFVNGYGLTWNITERVQCFTHPLWTFVLSIFYFLTREIYFTSLTVSILISLSAVSLLILKLSDSNYNSILVILILVFSQSFIDYSTSGLDNPLTHLLLVVFFIIYFRYDYSNKKLFLLSFVASLAALNRLDIILICIPVLIVSLLHIDKLKGLLTIIAGFFPLIIWEVFSLLYYGFLFPNTAYAKLNTGIEYFQLVEQGLCYLLFSVFFDTITPIVLLVGLTAPFFIKNKNLYPISIGIFLYLIYTVNVGGDFMGGRFLSASLLCSIIIISKFKIKPTKGLILQIVSVVVIGLLSPKPTFISTSDPSPSYRILKALKVSTYMTRTYHGIVDERSFYYIRTGLIRNLTENQIFKYGSINPIVNVGDSEENVVLESIIGISGYYLGPKIHVIDLWALSDPLLSKLYTKRYLPFDDFNPQDTRRWRIGHFEREIPRGYIETIRTGINHIEDPNLHAYYEKLNILIKGDVWNTNRFKEIWNFNLGKYNYLLENYERNKNSHYDTVTTK